MENSTSTPDEAGSHLLLQPLELYTPSGIEELAAKVAADKEKGIVKRTMEVFSSVVQEENAVETREKNIEVEVKGKEKEEERQREGQKREQ